MSFVLVLAALACAARAAAGDANGFLSLNSFPPGRISIDGVPTGLYTPLLRHPLAPGDHVVEIADAETEFSAEISFSIDSGKETRFGIRLPKQATGRSVTHSVPAAKPGSGFLTLNSLPPAEVFVDGAPGTGGALYTPLVRYPLAPGRHVIEMVEPETRARRSVNVTIVAGEEATERGVRFSPVAPDGDED